MDKIKKVKAAFLEMERNSIMNLYNNIDAIPKQVYMSLFGNLINIGKYEILDGSDLWCLKNRFNQAGLMYNYYNESFNEADNYWMSGIDLSYIVMSDNMDLLKLLYSNCKYEYKEKYPIESGVIALFQMVCGDWEGLKNTHDFIEKYADNTFWQSKVVWLSIYQSVLNGEASILKEQIKLLDSADFKRSRVGNDPAEKNISPYSIALTKIAIIHNIDIDIASRYIPMNILSFEPLKDYTIPYKFLRDYYRPLGYNWRYDPVYPELQDWDNDPENPDRDKGGFCRRLFN